MNVYTENGYKSREDYLNTLAEDNGLTLQEVKTLSGVLGPSEDFDALVTFTEDYASSKQDEYVPTDEELDSLSLDAARLETEMKLFGSTRNRTLDMNTGEILEGAYGAAYVVSSLREVAFNDDQIIGILMSRGLPVPEELIKKDEPGN